MPTIKANQSYAYNISMIYSPIWTRPKQELLIFLEKLNSKYKTIKFENNIHTAIYIFGQIDI